MSSAKDEFDELMRDKEHRSRHPQDDDENDARSFLNLSDDDDDNDDNENPPQTSSLDAEDIAPRLSTNPPRNTIPLKRYNANTGPKGVIADAQNFRDSRRSHRQSLGAVSSQLPVAEKLAEVRTHGEDSDEEEEDDPDFMHKWRLARLHEMQTGARENNFSSQQRHGRKWGTLKTVDAYGYLDALENSPSETIVVVYIYDDYSQLSNNLEKCVQELAQKHLDVRFIKLHFEEAEMEPTGVPALIAYRGGEKFADLVPIIQEMPDDADVDAASLESVLKRRQILR